jgi:ABC-type nickel/cobalt efflux system permease component RcnA
MDRRGSLAASASFATDWNRNEYSGYCSMSHSVTAFIFGDLIIPPILNIYRKYYGGKMTWYVLVTFYVTMVLAALAVELIFGVAGLVPQQRNVSILTESITFNYTTVLNIIFAVVSIVLIVVFYKSGGPEMMKMMNEGGHDHGAGGHGHHHEHGHDNAPGQRDAENTHEHRRQKR